MYRSSPFRSTLNTSYIIGHKNAPCVRKKQKNRKYLWPVGVGRRARRGIRKEQPGIIARKPGQLWQHEPVQKKALFKRKVETQISGWTSRGFSTARSTRRKNTTPMGLNHLASCLEWLDNTPCQLQCCGQRWCSYLGHYSSPFYCWSKWHKSIMIYKTNMSRGFDP